LVFSAQAAAVSVAHGFEAMASPKSKFNVVKIELRSTRFVDEAGRIDLCSTPKRLTLFRKINN